MTDFQPVAGGDDSPRGPIDPRHDAFVELRDARRNNIVRLCTSILHDADAAEEATEEAFATMWQAILDGREDAYRIPWLRAVAHDHCFDILRERKRTAPADGTSIRGALPALGAYKVGFGASSGAARPGGQGPNPLHGMFGSSVVATTAGAEPRLFGPWHAKHHVSTTTRRHPGPVGEHRGAGSIRRVGAVSSALVFASAIVIATFGPALVLPHNVLATVTHKTTESRVSDHSRRSSHDGSRHHRSNPRPIGPTDVDDVAAAISSAVTVTATTPPPPVVTTTTIATTTTVPPVTSSTTPTPTTNAPKPTPTTTAPKRHPSATVPTTTPTTVPKTTTTTVAPAVTSPGSTGSGAGPTGVSGNWSMNFDDEFNGTGLDTSKWSPTWFGGGTMNNVSTSSSNVTESNGVLSLSLSSPGVGALVDTNPSDAAKPGFTFTYGYVEARIWFPGSGQTIDNWPAFWTDGQNWPNDGEIDIAEGLGSMSGNYHSSAGTFNSPEPDTTISTGGSWHVYGVDWEPGSITWYIDGQVVHTLTSATTSITSSPQYIIFNVGAGHTAAVGTSMQVDWVREWSKA